MSLNLYSTGGIFVPPMLYPKLVAEVKRIRSNNTIRPLDVSTSKIFDIINKELNLNIACILENDMSENAYVQLPLLNKDHPYLKRYNTEVLSMTSIVKLNKAGSGITGGFDSKGKAYGLFAELETAMVITRGLLGAKYTDENIAAILCHEIGHYRDALFKLKYAFTTNHLLQNAVNAFMNAGGREERITLVTEFEDAVGTVIVEKEDLVNRRDEALFLTVVVGAMKERGCSEINVPNFDVSACEQAADQFAIACGVGDELGKALSLRPGYFTPDRIPRPLYYSFDLITTVAKIGAFVAGGPIVQAIMLCTIAAQGSPLAREYDKGGERIARQRRALITQSKSSDLSKAERQTLVTQLETLNDIEQLYTDKTPIFEFLWSRATPQGRRDRRTSNLVKAYEELVSNELHVAANALKAV